MCPLWGSVFNPVLSGLFLSFGARAEADLPPLHNFESIKSMTMRLGGDIERTKMSPLRSATRSDDVMRRCYDIKIVHRRPCWICILHFWISPKLRESTEIERKVIRTNTGTLIWAKNIKVTERKVIFLHLKKGFSIFCKN